MIQLKIEFSMYQEHVIQLQSMPAFNMFLESCWLPTIDIPIILGDNVLKITIYLSNFEMIQGGSDAQNSLVSPENPWKKMEL